MSTVLRQASHHNAVTDMFVHTLQDTLLFSNEHQWFRRSEVEDIVYFAVPGSVWGVLVLAAAVYSLIGLIELG